MRRKGTASANFFSSNLSLFWPLLSAVLLVGRNILLAGGEDIPAFRLLYAVHLMMMLIAVLHSIPVEKAFGAVFSKDYENGCLINLPENEA